MNPFNALRDYLRSVVVELRKVSWPSSRTTLNYSALVIGISVITAAGFAALDYGFTKLAETGAAAKNNIAAPADQSASTTPSSPIPGIDIQQIDPSTVAPTSTN